MWSCERVTRTARGLESATFLICCRRKWKFTVLCYPLLDDTRNEIFVVPSNSHVCFPVPWLALRLRAVVGNGLELRYFSVPHHVLRPYFIFSVCVFRSFVFLQKMNLLCFSGYMKDIRTNKNKAQLPLPKRHLCFGHICFITLCVVCILVVEFWI